MIQELKAYQLLNWLFSEELHKSQSKEKMGIGESRGPKICYVNIAVLTFELIAFYVL